MDHKANQAQPTASPARTSVNQCTPSRTLVPATATATATAKPASAARARRLRRRPRSKAITAKVAAAEVACPEGNEDDEKPVSCWRSGRARSTITLIKLTSAYCPPTVRIRRAGIARLAMRRYSTAPTITARLNTPRVPPRSVIRRSAAVEAEVAWIAPQRAKARS